jgi:glycine dehydrogenase
MIKEKICLIPASAHGTNPASLHGWNEIIVTKTMENGNIDERRCKRKKLSIRPTVLFNDNTSTHGVLKVPLRNYSNHPTMEV